MRISSTVADRINVDIEGLRDRINQAHADNPLWAKLSVSQKLRQLIEERLSQLESTQESK
jgi:hypothetical protein